MSCWNEHWLLLEVGIRFSPWQPPVLAGYGGRRAGTADPLNRMATLADEVGDWLWHKRPWSDAALVYGARRVAEDIALGDELGAALKAAYLTHCVADGLAVSHAWLGLLGEEEDLGEEAILRRLHDPVENLVIDHMEEVRFPDQPAEGEFAAAYRAGHEEALRIGREIMVRMRHGRNLLPQCLAGVGNAARLMTVYFGAVTTGDVSGLCDLDPEPRLRRWPGREILSWGGEEIMAALADPQAVPRLRAMTGFRGRNILFESWACSPEAREDFRLYRQDRAAQR